MRIFFISRRALVNVSLLAVLIGLVGALKILGGNAGVVQWVSAGLGATSPPLFMSGQPENRAVSLLVQLDSAADPAEVGQFLQILADNSARATFFVSGELAAEQPQLLQSVLAGGHQIGSFGYDDTSPADLTLAENRAALERASAQIAAACGERPLVYLPPYGVTEPDIRRAAAEAGLVFVLGGVDSGDWQAEQPEEIIAAVLGQAQPGSFITLSVNENTLAGLNTLLKELAALDLRFFTVSENLDKQGVRQEAIAPSDIKVEPNDTDKQAAAPPKVSAGAALLLDAQTGRVLWQQNGYEPLPPASTTKILTALVCLDLAPLEREVQVSAAAAAVGESSAGLLAGERFALGELLDAALLKSANDACYAIAEGVAGSEPFFVHLMNVKAAACGAFTVSARNTNGLPAEGHLFSCYDLACLAREAMQRSEFRQRVGSRYGVMEGGSYNRSLKNTNKLLTMDEHVTGIKTGTTNAAGACLVSSMERDGRSVIAVVLHSADRYNDSLRLLNWGVDNFRSLRLVRAGQPLAVWLAGEDELWLAAERDLLLPVSYGEEPAGAYHFKPLLERHLRAGVAAGEVLGTLELTCGDCRALVNLAAAEDWQPSPKVRLKAGWQKMSGILGGALQNIFS